MCTVFAVKPDKNDVTIGIAARATKRLQDVEACSTLIDRMGAPVCEHVVLADRPADRLSGAAGIVVAAVMRPCLGAEFPA